MKQTTTSEFGPLANADAQTGYGSIVLVLLLVGALAASSYPRLALGVAIGLAIVPLARRTHGALARGIQALRRRTAANRRPPTQSTTHR